MDSFIMVGLCLDLLDLNHKSPVINVYKFGIILAVLLINKLLLIIQLLLLLLLIIQLLFIITIIVTYYSIIVYNKSRKRIRQGFQKKKKKYSKVYCSTWVELRKIRYTVKFLYKDHLRDQQNVVLIDRWCLYASSIAWKYTSGNP